MEIFKEMFDSLNPFKSLQEQVGDVTKGVKDQVKSLGETVISSLKLDFIKKFEPFIKEWKEKNSNNPALDFLLSPIDDATQLEKDDATAKTLGKGIEDSSLKLEDVVAAQFPNEDKKVAIFKKFAVNEVDPKNIPLNTGVSIRQTYIQKLLKKDTPFMTEYLKTTSMVHFIPDATVKKITVLHPRANMLEKGQTELYERKEVDGKLEFVNATGNILKLNEVAGFKVEEKDSGTQALKAAETNKKADETARIVVNEYSGGINTDSDKGRFVYKTFKSINTKLLGQPQEVACYATANKIMEKVSGEGIGHTKKPIFENKSASGDMLARTAIPNKIKELKLQPGTVFWIKLAPGNPDPNSTDSKSGNHWFTYIGNNPTSGEPQFVDQYGVQSAFGMEYTNSVRYKKGRYLHAIFTPNEKNMEVKLKQFLAKEPSKTQTANSGTQKTA